MTSTGGARPLHGLLTLAQPPFVARSGYGHVFRHGSGGRSASCSTLSLYSPNDVTECYSAAINMGYGYPDPDGDGYFGSCLTAIATHALSRWRHLLQQHWRYEHEFS